MCVPHMKTKISHFLNKMVKIPALNSTVAQLWGKMKF